jgi:histone-lysine N-methyltransferase SETD1
MSFLTVDEKMSDIALSDSNHDDESQITELESVPKPEPEPVPNQLMEYMEPSKAIPPRSPATSKVPKTKEPKKGRKGVSSKSKRQEAVYTKPVRTPIDFDELERTERELQDKKEIEPIPVDIPDDFDSDASLDWDRISLNEDSEDEKVIQSLIKADIEKRRESRAKKQSANLRTAEGLRKHISGSARTEGYYKISSAEKKLQLRLTAAKKDGLIGKPSKSTVATNIAQDLLHITSRTSRIQHRHFAIGLETQKRSVPADAADSIRFNQLKARKKQLKFDRSNIHDWGLFAMERIEANEMIIEYIGEKIRQKVLFISCCNDT